MLTPIVFEIKCTIHDQSGLYATSLESLPRNAGVADRRRCVVTQRSLLAAMLPKSPVELWTLVLSRTLPNNLAWNIAYYCSLETLIQTSRVNLQSAYESLILKVCWSTSNAQGVSKAHVNIVVTWQVEVHIASMAALLRNVSSASWTQACQGMKCL